MSRIDLPETIKRVDFPENIWDWLDYLEEVLVATQQEAIYQEKGFMADTPFKKYLQHTINKDLSTLNSIYILLRCEMIHQASSHARLFCESLITMKYISLDPDARSDLFWGYSDIESFEISSSLIEWEKSKAKPQHVEKIETYIKSIVKQYEKAKQTYSYTNKKGQTKLFRNWCNKSISLQARECGDDFHRLYDLVYKQLSSYVHGSSWSLRKQMAYSRAHYDSKVILTDIASIIRTTLVVWMDWAKFCVSNLDWRLIDVIKSMPDRMEALDTKYFNA